MTVEPTGEPPALRTVEDATIVEGLLISDTLPAGWPSHGTINGHAVPLHRIERRLVDPSLVYVLKVVIDGVEQRPLRHGYETIATTTENGRVVAVLTDRELWRESEELRRREARARGK